MVFIAGQGLLLYMHNYIIIIIIIMRVLNTLSGDMCTVQYRCVCVCRCKTELSPAQSAAQSPALSPG